MLKQRLQGFIAGVLITVLIIGTLTFATPFVREVFYGVNVVVNGVPQEFDDDMQPFIMDGRTFLPVRGIAEALDVPVDWDSETQTVYVGRLLDGLSPDRITFVGGDGILIMTGWYVESAAARFDVTNQGLAAQREWHISLTLSEEGRVVFTDATDRLSRLQGQFNSETGMPMNTISVKLDGEVITAPQVLQRLDMRELIITGDFSQEDAEFIVNILNSGR